MAFRTIDADIRENNAKIPRVFSNVLLVLQIRLVTFTVSPLRKLTTTLTISGIRPQPIGALPNTQPGGGGEGLANLLDFDVG